MNCKAKQFSDQMSCECGNVWDVNDPSPPSCPAPYSDIVSDGGMDPRACSTFKLVGYLDGRGRFFYADDPLYKDRNEGMERVYSIGGRT